jgi:GNAT superfamily N-acetyltransferase
VKIADIRPNGIKEFEKYISEKYKVETFWLYEERGMLKLDMIKVAKGDRKQGIGTAIMEELTAFADRLGKMIVLYLGQKDDRHGTTSSDRLRRFYKRFGFVDNKGRNKDYTLSYSMYRKPKNS